MDWFDFWKVITTFLGGGIVGSALLYFIIKKFIDHIFQTEFEKYKFNYQRMIHDFSIYSNKRHEIYQELYKKILLANAKANLPFGIQAWPEIENPLELINNYLFERNIDHDNISNILRVWELDPKKGLTELQYVVRADQLRTSKVEFLAAQDYFLISELYLSENVRIQVGKITDNLRLYINSTILHHITLGEKNDDQFRYLLTDVDKEIKNLRNQMKNELSVGDYDENRLKQE